MKGRPWRMATALVALAVLMGPAGRADAKPRVPKLNAKVLKYARAKIGKKVGNGECWTLAFRALGSARARLPGRKGKALYVFGRSVPLTALRPGDILQFEKVRFEQSFASTGRTYGTIYPHHTAIVAAVKGQHVSVLHQNYQQVKKVTTITLALAHRKGGSLKAYRPQKR